MKKLIIAAVCILFAGAANAQKIGIKGGLNLSNIIKTGDNNFSTDFKPGLNAGLVLEIPIVKTFSFEPELMFSQKGYKTSGTSLLGGPNEYSVTTNFIEVPILAKFNASDRFSIVLGPQVSFLTSTTEKFTEGSSSYQNTIREENDRLKKSLAGGVAGFGIVLSKQLDFHARYALDFQKNNEDGTSETPIYKNQVAQFGLAFKFN
ncbi:porin family protein [Daejeonella sp. H1SJ63]|jgi:hypothetical protein|uniref:porin family protein n=1 Tax=Daejeonella sp. H1SJ63 TaxID=3034145 RepID=UPI0023EAD31B|nr:porin family protein [Daejeonella sp. H1SJ63]